MIGPSKASVSHRPHRGMFQRPGPPVPDGTGWVQSWIDLPPSVEGKITPASQAALERIAGAANTVIAMATHIVTIPYRSNLTTEARFIVDGRQLSVLGIFDEEERHVELELVCAEIVQ
jgi:SPP1 family predicted phage head-tail adaptor